MSNMEDTTVKKVIHSRSGKYSGEKYLDSLLVSNTWKIIDSTESDDPKSIDLKSYFEGMSIEFIVTIKLILLSTLKVVNGNIDAKIFTVLNLLGSVSHLRRALSTMNLRSSKEINENNVEKFFEALIFKSGGGFYARNTIRNSILKFLMEASRSDRKYPDGPSILVTWDMFVEWAKPIVMKEMEWSEWWDGGTLGGFPVEFSLVILDESLKVIGDEKAIMLARAHIHGSGKALQKFPSMKLADIAQVTNNLAKKNKEKRYFGVDDKGFYQIWEFNSATKKVYEDDPLSKRSIKTFTFAKNIIEEYINIGGDLDDFNFLPRSDINNIVQDSLYACGSVIQLLSGIRDSEFQSLRRSSFSKDKFGGTQFTSGIKKNNHNVETDRFISNCTWDAVNVAKSLHMNPIGIGEVCIEDKLLRAYVPWRGSPICGDVWWADAEAGRKSGLTNWMNRKLKGRIVDIDLTLYPNATSHRFRHTWVEIALRRFDGNVPEAIRQHLRHAYGSYNTMAYMRGKVKQDLPQLEREYIREIIGRAASGKEEFFGPVGVYIVQRLKESESLTDEELDKIVDEFEHIEAHEYGYCLIRKSQKTQAKCYDKSTDSPNYNSAKFSNCGGCAGAMRMPIHRDAILRIGMREKEVLKSREENGLTHLSKQTKKTLKLCEIVIKEFDKQKTLIEDSDEETPYEHF